MASRTFLTRHTMTPSQFRPGFAARFNSTYQPPTPPTPKPSQHSQFYRTFGRPIAKNFLIALATYQLLYLSWLKLESLETKSDKEDEIRSLERELKGLTKGRPAS